ncbi:hydantoinase/oxoprolinase family protein [Aquibium sp. LZ166]|uniref:Hydantoinase/oxoprolinase family protein n=1 Tax=Aquibium pacificus TaxID=3153579 RepID=A0ABV3SHD6_9HYPH
MRFAVDTGGTFTDLVVEDDSGLCRLYKAATTPHDPVAGMLDALTVAAEAAGRSLPDFLAGGNTLLHGTTHAINAIITGRTARTALLTTSGHGDILVLREGGRAETFNFTHEFPEPYIPRSLTFEVPERVMADGSVRLALDEKAVLEQIERLKENAVEAVAVCLLWSIVNPAHELRIGELLAEHLPGVPFTLSHKLNPAVREFRRASSAAVDASLKPMIARYMSDLERRLREAGFGGRVLIVTSQAGVIDAADAAQAPIHIVNSGPSMAPIAGRHYAAIDSSAEDAIIADTGGTTYDVSIVRKGNIPTTRETWIGPQYRGIMLGFPWVDVKSVGAGGGSIASIDSGGLLRVGPASAGAVPGPAAYGRGGTHATVTDAAVVLGHIDPAYFLGGAMTLDPDAAREAVERDVAGPGKLPVAEAADAILTIATENMVQAILDITVKQGIDPRNAVLIGGGGAAGLNSVRIARRLGCRTLIIPETGPALSAAGALMSELKAEYHAAQVAHTDSFDHDAVNATLAALARKAQDFAAGPGAGALETTITFKADARYATEVWEIEVPLRDGKIANAGALSEFVEDFHRTHEMLFSFRDEGSFIEVVGWTASVTCRLSERKDLRLASPAGIKEKWVRNAWFAGIGWAETAVYRFEALKAGERIDGPAIVENDYTTVIVDPGASAERRPSGSLVIDVGQQ